MVMSNTGRPGVNVMQLTDTLNLGGAERVAVNLANLLPRERYGSFLCTTRSEGPLEDNVAPHVKRLRLRRKHRFDGQAIRSLVSFIRANDIHILHAHVNSLFIATVAALFRPHPIVIWHDHYGNYAVKDRPAWLYRVAMKQTSGVIAVNRLLAQWSLDSLGVVPDRVWYIPNFVLEPRLNGKVIDLPGRAGSRIVCVANLRSQKDHFTLLRAMSHVVREMPAAHLLLVGAVADQSYLDRVQRQIAEAGLGQNVSLLGERQDVSSILQACDVGVLSSVSEGFPLSLIEYGTAKLPAVATSVGQCADVLDQGQAGLLVPSGAAEQMAESLLLLLRSSERRLALGEAFHQHVQRNYSAAAVIDQICKVYESVQTIASK
jgi:glycosyltransferase involved in cell wall biosynthesis